MRALLVALIAAVTLALPASAEIDPKALVLAEVDLPAGFRLNQAESYVVSNARFVRAVPANQKLVARSGRVTGYLARYDKGSGRQLRTIQSLVHEFGSREGARTFLLWIDAEQRRRNAKRGVLLRDGRATTPIGDQSWVYWSGYPGYYTMVTWRQARFLGIVASWGSGREPTLALARVQQRRIAAAVR